MTIRKLPSLLFMWKFYFTTTQPYAQTPFSSKGACDITLPFIGNCHEFVLIPPMVLTNRRLKKNHWCFVNLNCRQITILGGFQKNRVVPILGEYREFEWLFFSLSRNCVCVYTNLFNSHSREYLEYRITRFRFIKITPPNMYTGKRWRILLSTSIYVRQDRLWQIKM